MRRNALEHAEQVAFFDWVRVKSNQDDRYKMIYAVPNGGGRHPAEAYRLKQAGVKAGVPDIAVDVPSKGFHGLKIEMKYGRNKPSEAQSKFLTNAQNLGYATAVCYSAGEAIKVLEEYLNGG